MKKPIKTIGIIVVCIMVFGLYFINLGSNERTDNELIVGLDIGNLAPDFTLQNLEGETKSLSDYSGKILILNFWSTRCPTCIVQMYEIASVYELDKFEVISISITESREVISAFVASNGFEWTFLLDPRAEVSIEYMVRFLPQNIFIDEEGIIREKHAGFLNESQIRAIIGVD